MKYIIAAVIVMIMAVSAFCQTAEYSLRQCILLAIENNTDLKTARNQIISAKADTAVAKSDYFPNINLRNQTFETTMHNNGTMEKGTTLNADLKLFDTGLRYLTLQSAKKSEKQTLNQVFRTYQTVLYNVMNSYYNCQRYSELIDLKTASVKYYDEQEKIYKDKISLGELAEVDIYPIQASQADAKVSLLSAKNAFEDSKRNLINLLGLDETAEIILTKEQVDITDELKEINEYLTIAKDNRKDLLANDFAVQNAKLNKRIADMDLWPIFHINAEYSNDFNNKNSFGKHDDGRIMGYIDWNLFDGFNTQARIRQSKVRLDNAVETKASLERDIKTNLKNLYTDILISKEQLEASNLGFQSADKNREVQKEKFNLNMNTNLDILNAQVQYDTSLSNLINSRYDLKISYIELDYQTGLLGTDLFDTEQLNKIK